jgi:hypothetical protein
VRILISLFGVVGAIALLVGGAAHATPVCTGGTLTAPGGIGTFTQAQLGADVCVQAQDKLFGTFSFGNLPSTITVDFNFTVIPGADHHDISFSGPFASGSHYSDFGYEVIINPSDPANSITDLFADFTQSTGGPSTLLKSTTPSGTGTVDMTKTGPVCSPCNNHIFYGDPGVSDLLVVEDLTIASGAQVSSILNTLIQQRNTIPEPASLAVLGAALLGYGIIRRRRKSA